jgi:alanine racemase
MSIILKDIFSVVEATFTGNYPENVIENVSIDSRSFQNNPQTLFFCLIGQNNNGHDYIEELIQKGVRNFIVSQPIKNYDTNVNFIVVENTLKALQQFAAYYRKQFHFPIIGITGSNGKTIVKEWLNFLLSPEYIIIRSPKSYNSQVGVPLSVIGINEHHNLGIFEAGISTINEMENLEAIIQPTIGILTNIGSAHDEGFDHLGEKIKEKLKLFPNVEVLIYNKNKSIDAFLNPTIKTFSWSSSDKNADVIIHHKTTKNETNLNITFQNTCFKFNVPFSDDASIENVIQCLMVLFYFKYDFETIQHRLSLLYPIEMRLKVKKGINNTTLIDDSYSSDFQSLKIALDFLESQKQHHKKTLILSDIFQSGLGNDVLYSRLSLMIVSNKINRIIGIGETISHYKSKFLNGTFFNSKAEFLDQFDHLNFENETILIKGARHFNFEEIVSLLEEKTHETVLEINLNALTHNLNYYRAKLKPSTKIMVMVKAFSYGTGGLEIAKLLEYQRVDYLGVAFADEGIALKSNGIQLPIMVLNPENTSFESIIQHQLEPEIYSLKGLHSFLKMAKQKRLIDFPIHLKIDTGMHRLGFEEQHISELITILKNNKTIKVKSILSHLATSDDAENRDFAMEQIEKFDRISSQLQSELEILPLRHILNTSGISNFPEAQYEMVRLGIGLYGFSNQPKEQAFLEPVGTLKSIISQIRTIQAGESVGYGRRFMATQEMRIATIPIGYADGIRRSWGNGLGFVVIKKQKATILGSICMDMLMVDVTSIACVEGNEVIVLGESPNVAEMAKKLDTIPYEILTGISQRVKRIFYRE